MRIRIKMQRKSKFSPQQALQTCATPSTPRLTLYIKCMPIMFDVKELECAERPGADNLREERKDRRNAVSGMVFLEGPASHCDNRLRSMKYTLERSRRLNIRWASVNYTPRKVNLLHRFHPQNEIPRKVERETTHGQDRNGCFVPA